MPYYLTQIDPCYAREFCEFTTVRINRKSRWLIVFVVLTYRVAGIVVDDLAGIGADGMFGVATMEFPSSVNLVNLLMPRISKRSDICINLSSYL